MRPDFGHSVSQIQNQGREPDLTLPLPIRHGRVAAPSRDSDHTACTPQRCRNLPGADFTCKAWDGQARFGIFRGSRFTSLPALPVSVPVPAGVFAGTVAW